MSEYLIEVTPGRELVFRTPWALRAAMREGTITADSRIFHRATARWISITKHPEYRRYQAEPPKERATAESYHPRVTGWAAIKKRFGSKGANAPKPTRTSPPSAAPAPTQPNQAGPRAPAPRDRWTFFG